MTNLNQRRFLNVGSSVVTSGVEPRLVRKGLAVGPMGHMGFLSPSFYSRMQRFSLLEPDWDGFGARAVPNAVIKKAQEIASQSIVIAPEPFAAPSGDGSLLLKWDFPNGFEVECFVEVDGLSEAAVSHAGNIEEIPLPHAGALLGLLRKVATEKAP